MRESCIHGPGFTFPRIRAYLSTLRSLAKSRFVEAQPPVLEKKRSHRTRPMSLTNPGAVAGQISSRLLLALAVATFVTGLGQAQELTVLNSGTQENLRGISALHDGVAWASGTHGTSLKTLDRGAHWSVAQVPHADDLDFRDVQAFSADTAYLLSAGPGELSRIYKTTDGGKSWGLQYTNKDPKGFLDAWRSGMSHTESLSA